MLVTLNEIMAIAAEKGCGMGAFNTPNLECLTAVLDAAEELKIPVIISHAEVQRCGARRWECFANVVY